MRKYEEVRDIIIQMERALGNTNEEITDNLTKRGFYSECHESQNCPIYNYLKREVEEVSYVIHKYVYVDVNDYYAIPTQFVTNTKEVTDWIREFDSKQAYKIDPWGE